MATCDHPRPKLNLPGYTPPRFAWQPPAYLPTDPAALTRSLTEAFRGIYAVLQQLGQRRTVVPLIEDIEARAGQVIVGVGAGQTILLPEGVGGELGQVAIVLTDVSSPVTVVHPDGTTTQLGAAGAYDFVSGIPDAYQTNPGGTTTAGDGLSGGGGTPLSVDVAAIAGAGLESDGSNNLRIAASAAGAGLIGGAGSPLAVGAGTGIAVNANDVQLATIVAKSVLSNATNATLVPSALAGSGAFQHLRVNAANTGLEWAVLSLATFPTMATGTFLANITGSTAVPTAHPLATFAGAGLTYTNVTGIMAVGAGTHITVNTDDVAVNLATLVPAIDSASVIANGTVLERAALTGFAQATQNSNATTSAEPIVTFSASANMSNERVLSDGTGTTIDIGTAGQIQVDLTDMAAGTVKGRQIDAGTGAPVDLTGAEVGELARRTGSIIDTTSTGTISAYDAGGTLNSTVTQVLFNFAANVTLNGMVVLNGQTVQFFCQSGMAGSVTVAHEANGGFSFRTPSALPFTVRANEGFTATYWFSRWFVDSVAKTPLANQADDTFLANISGGSAPPAAVALTTLAGAGLTGGADAILAVGAGTHITVAANDVAVNVTTLVADIDSASIIASSGTLQRAALTGDVTSPQNSNVTTIADNTVGNGQLVNMAQSTIKGRAEGAGTGDPQDLTPTQVVAIIDGEPVTWTGDQTFTSSHSLNGVISPSALTANVNNYNPTGWGTANVVRLSTNGTAATTWDITGALEGADGEIKYLVGLGPGNIRLQHENASSTSTNRFRFTSLTTFTINPEDMVGIWYDGTSGRWRVMSFININ